MLIIRQIEYNSYPFGEPSITTISYLYLNFISSLQKYYISHRRKSNYGIMRKILLFVGVLFICSNTWAQFTEKFTDSDFISHPTWTGDTALFRVNTALQLQLNASGEGIAALCASNALLPDMEWNVWAKLSFAPSDNNLARIYLSSDQANLKGPLNGYYLKLGETGSADAIELIRQSGNSHTVICRGSEGLLAASFAIRIRVTREAGGLWNVYADPLGGIYYQFQASGTDNTYATGSFLGVYCKFTSSNSTKFYYDDFYAGQVLVDNTPPTLLSVALESASQLTATFSEAVETASASSTVNYSLIPGSIVPASATQDLTDPSLIHIAFEPGFTPDTPYSLVVANVKDLAGNIMTSAALPFAWHEAKAFDILINEIMADPSPPVNLPDAEYVELYNRSAYPVDLKDWTFVLGSGEKKLPTYTLQAGAYLILCDDGIKPLLEPYGTVLAFSSFGVTNAGGTITLKDNSGRVIHTVSYTDDWYQSSYKKDGGWSLEMIDEMNPCGEASNWIACNNDAGGTPGYANSVNALNPDLAAPAISRVGVEDATHITVWFSESCDSAQVLNAFNYSIDNGIGNPVAVSAQSPAYRVAHLSLPSPMTAGVLYTLTCANSITDCAGNPFFTGSTARFAIPSPAEASDIVINEMLFDPPTGCVDFVEIYNRSPKVIDLSDLILSNYDSINQVISSYNEISDQPFLMLPDAYFALTTDSAAVHRFYKTIDPQAFINMVTFPTMNNEDGVVALTTKSGTVIDLAAYTSAMQYPLLTSVDGVALERISPERATKDATNWHSASEAVGFATPGYKNSQFGITVASDGEIRLSPEIFSPDNDGYNDNLAIAYAFGEAGNIITITIYDATGRLVRNVVNNEMCGTSGTFAWDGITNDRLKASIGRYIVFVETFDLQGHVKHFKKGTVLGGKL
jgi:hypothetical protein